MTVTKLILVFISFTFATTALGYTTPENIKNGGRKVLEVPDPEYFGRIGLPDKKKQQIREIYLKAAMARNKFEKAIAIASTDLSAALDNPDSKSEELHKLHKQLVDSKNKFDKFNFTIMTKVREVMNQEELGKLITWQKKVQENAYRKTKERMAEMKRAADERRRQRKVEDAKKKGAH